MHIKNSSENRDIKNVEHIVLVSLERTLPLPFVRRGPRRPKKDTPKVKKEPKKRGRPLGAKNKKTLLREQKEREKLNPPEKRKPGRPRKEGT